jgi:hypothetical protein
MIEVEKGPFKLFELNEALHLAGAALALSAGHCRCGDPGR